MTSLYELNILNQLEEWKRLLKSPLPSAIYTINPTKRRIVFVGIGSSYWAARFSEFLWREFVNPDCISLQSYDLVRSKYLISPNDIFVVFSHRGTKTFSIQSLDVARKSRPKFHNSLVIVGDLIREVVAHEVALKISETCYIPVRSFGLEQFLHGPRVTIDRQSTLVAFTSVTEPRKDSLIKYAETVGTEVIEINENTFNVISKEFTWLAQLLYGQQLALELSKRLGTNPDTVRSDQYPYKHAKEHLML